MKHDAYITCKTFGLNKFSSVCDSGLKPAKMRANFLSLSTLPSHQEEGLHAEIQSRT